MKVIIPAAGLGKRFASQGIETPKELLPLGGKSLIAHAIAEAARAGFESATVVISPTKERIREFLAKSELPLPVDIAIQQSPLGTGDAVLSGWRGEPVGVLLPDDVVLGTEHWARLIELHRLTGAATLCVRTVPIETTSRFGIADCDGDRVVGLIEKPSPGSSSSNLAIFGRYVVTEPVTEALHSTQVGGELELTFGFALAAKAPPWVRAVRFEGEIYDCGTPLEYASSVTRFAGSYQHG